MVFFKPSERVGQLPVNFFNGLDERLAHAETNSAKPYINLSKGNPDLPTPVPIIEAMKRAVENPENHAYPPFLGKQSLRQSIVAFYKREYDVFLDPDTEVSIFHGAHIGITAIPQVLLNSGDYLLTTDPCYPIYHSAASLARASIYAMPLTREHDFLPDYQVVPDEIRKKSQLLLLNYPNNPTGVLANEAFYQETIHFAKRNKLAVLNDFAYASLGFNGHKPLSILQTDGAKDYAVEVYTLSKTFNMAGWRIGFAVGNASIIQALNHFQTHACSTVFGAVQDAAICALNSDARLIRQIVTIYEKRRDFLINHLRQIGWNAPYPAGTFFAWLPVPHGFDSQTFTNLLFEQAHLVVAPGIGFGQQGAGYIRVSLVHPTEVLEEAIARIDDLHLFRK